MTMTLNGVTGITYPDNSTQVTAPNGFGFHNRFINGGLNVDQRNNGAAQTITAAAALAYIVDRWYAYCTGANVTGQQIAGTYASSQNRYQFTGAASVTSIGFGQRIESKNSYDLANTTTTLSCYISNSLLTTVTWTAYYATTTADTFGSLASPTVTSIATGTFTVTSTRAQYTANISIPSAATTGIQIVFTVGAQTSGTWIVDTIQLEVGSTATAFDYRDYGRELIMCQRYCYVLGGETVNQVFALGFNTSTTVCNAHVFHPVKMRSAPALAVSAASDFVVSNGLVGSACTVLTTGGAQSSTCSIVIATTASGLTTSQAVRLEGTSTTNAHMYWSSEL